MDHIEETVEAYRTALYRAQEERDELREKNNAGQLQLKDLEKTINDVVDVLVKARFLEVANSDLPLCAKVATALAIYGRFMAVSKTLE